MSKIELFDVVELTEGIPGTPFRAGLTGTVIDMFPTGAFEVEFESLEEDTGEIVTRGFWPSQLHVVMPFANMQTVESSRPIVWVNLVGTAVNTAGRLVGIPRRSPEYVYANTGGTTRNLSFSTP